MAQFVGVVYDPPRDGFPHLAVLFNQKDMTKTLVAQPVDSPLAGEALIQELATGLAEMAKRDGYL